MVANAVLAIVLSAAAAAIAFGVKHVGHARRLGEAERIGGSQMEALIAEAHALAPTISARGGFTVPAFRNVRGEQRFASDGRPAADGEYTASWVIENDRPIPRAQHLSLTVTWREDTERSLRLATYFTQPDPCDDPSGLSSFGIDLDDDDEDPCAFPTSFGGR